MKWGKWSTTAASNSATPPDGWPEGQAPSTVNDCAREMMASIRTGLNEFPYIDYDLSPTQTGNTTFTVPGNQTGIFEIGRRVKAFDTTTLYGTVTSASFTTNTGVSLRLDSGLLTASMTAVSVAMSRAQALPENVYRPQAINVNGMMDVWQAYTGTIGISGSPGIAFAIADNWVAAVNGSSVCNVTRLERSASASNVPALAQAGVLINSCIGITVSAGDAALAGSDYGLLSTYVEGYDYRQVAGKPLSVQFWVHSNRTGTYALALRNGPSPATRSYVTDFAISAVNTWERKTFTIPEPPQVGFDYSQGTALRITICYAAGATYQGTANAWTAMDAIATSSTSNFLASAGNSLRVAALKVNEGTTCTPYDNEPVSVTLDKCKRYLQVIPSGVLINGFAISTNRALFSFYLEQEMRSVPAVSVPALTSLNIVTGGGANASISAVNVPGTVSNRAIQFDVTTTGTPLTLGQGAFFNVSTGAAMIVLDSRMT